MLMFDPFNMNSTQNNKQQHRTYILHHTYTHTQRQLVKGSIYLFLFIVCESFVFSFSLFFILHICIYIYIWYYYNMLPLPRKGQSYVFLFVIISAAFQVRKMFYANMQEKSKRDLDNHTCPYVSTFGGSRYIII